jgi:protein TonB
LLDVFYPRETYSLKEGWSDVDFEFVANYEIPQPPRWLDELPQGLDLLLPAEIEEPEPAESPQVEMPVTAPAETWGQSSEPPAGESGDASVEPQFFPAVPRYIVPPTLADLEVASIEVRVRILVGTTGRPEQVVIADTLSSEAIKRRIISAARRFRFEPAKRGETPVASWVDLPLVLESASSR